MRIQNIRKKLVYKNTILILKMPSNCRTMGTFSPHAGPCISHSILWQVLIVLVRSVLLINAGNLNELPQWKVTIPDRPGIEFGFSLAHLYNQSEHRLLVGAPVDNSSQVNVTNPGAVYSCSFATDKSSADCEQLQVDWRNADDQFKGMGWIQAEDDRKNNQRLGAAIATSDKGVVVCAPNWHLFAHYVSGTEDLPLGICFEAREENNFIFREKTEFSPGYNSAKMTYKNTGACQAGISVAYSQNTKYDSIAIGSPGCIEWQGDTWQKDGGVLSDNADLVPFRSIGKVPLEDLNLIVDESSDNPFSSVGDTYLGYSVAVGEFGGVFGIVTTMPKVKVTIELKVEADQLDEVVSPMVHIYHYDTNDNNKLKHWTVLTPPENKTNTREAEPNALFSYFGHALAVADLDNDGLDDVIVGAPFYGNATTTKTGHDGGAIFVYMQKRVSSGNAESGNLYKMNRDNSKWLPSTLKLTENAQFGAAVAAIGDVNRDGYQDIAVGAPYFIGEDGHKGAVFIFKGGSDGLSQDPYQVLKASTALNDHAGPIIGFGHAIASKFSATEKHVTDLAVGAFQNDTVFIFRSKELIRVNMTKFDFSSNMDLTDKKCTYKSEPYACVKLKVCLNYEVELDMGWPDKNREFQIQIEADSKRIIIEESGARNYTVDMDLDENQQLCETLTLLAKNNIDDLINPFEVTYKVSFNPDSRDLATWTYDVVLTGTRYLNPLVNCTDPNPENCVADINLLANTKSNFTLMTSTNLQVEFVIENKGEQAYGTKLIIDSGGDLEISGQANATWKNIEWDETIVNCQPRILGKKTEIICNLAALFPRDETLRVKLSMSASASFSKNYETHPNYFEVKAKVYSVSKFTEPDQAKTTFKIPIIVPDQLDLTSNSKPQSVEYNSSYNTMPADARSFDELGPSFTHKYQLFNPESYEIYMSRCIIKWPIKLKGKYWNYLTRAPTFTGVQNAKCEFEGGEIDEYNIAEKSEKIRSKNNAIDPEIVLLPGSSSVIHSTRGEVKSLSSWNEDISWMTLTCDLGPISPRKEAIITLNSRLVQATLTDLKLGIGIQEMWSEATCEVTKLPLNAPPSGKISSKITETTIAYNNESPASDFPIWIIVVSAIGGLLLVVVISLIAWKCGFFKRKRPDQADGMETDKDGYQEVPKDDVEACEDIEKTEGDIEKTEGDIEKTEGDIGKTEGDIEKTEEDIEKIEGGIEKTEDGQGEEEVEGLYKKGEEEVEELYKKSVPSTPT